MVAGTAQKIVLNALSTATMVRLGKTYGNLMVDLVATNAKLRDRAIRIVALSADAEASVAASALHDAGGAVKTAIVMVRAGVDRAAAEARLAESAGFVRRAL
jgi:N-acetylmuramic acid 6-phosphate etherase